MQEVVSRFFALPAYGVGALMVILLYALQAEIRFGPRARSMRAGSFDRWSTVVLALAAQLPILSFVLAMKASQPGAISSAIPGWVRDAALPGLPVTAWLGVFIALCGLALRLWAVMRLRERYTRTLLVQHQHAIELSGPYRWVRHPGYLGSLLFLNGVALSSGNWIALLLSVPVTFAAYGYRIKVEDEMMMTAFGSAYAQYRLRVRALIPGLRAFRRPIA